MKLTQTLCNTDLLTRFLRGELSDSEIQAYEAHLSSCISCRTRLEEKTASTNEWDALRDSLSNAQESNLPSGLENLETLRKLLGPSDDPRMMGRIGTYEIVGLLGHGGMGVVFKAFDPSLNRYVAIKMLAPMLIPSVVFKQRFLREAQSAAAVVHDNVVGIHAISEWQGNQFGNPQAMLKAVLDQQGAFEVLIQDSEGVLHSPGASGSAGGSSSASGSGSGNGNGGGAFGKDSQSNSTQTFTFGGLPYGRDIKSVIVRATEKTGKPQSYPFKLQKVPVPYRRNPISLETKNGNR